MAQLVPPSAATSPTPSSGAPGGWRTRLRSATRRHPVRVTFVPRETYVAVALHLTLSVVGFVVLLLLNRHLGHTVTDLLHRWDSANYLSVAEHGYPDRLPRRSDGLPAYSTLAFFPFVPGLIRVLHLITGLSFAYAGVLISWMAGAVAASGVHTLARAVVGSPAAYVCVALWSCSPYAFVLWIPYSEAVFTAVLMWALVALLARSWVTAGLLCAVAGTVRPTACVLVAVVALTGLAALATRGDGLRPLAAAVLAPLGLIGSWLYLGSRIGSVTGWFEAQKAWGQSFDFGVGTLDFLDHAIGAHSPDMRYVTVLVTMAAVAIGVVALAMNRRVPWPLVLLVAVAWVLLVGVSGAPFSKPRFMLPFLPVLFLLLAPSLARLRRPVRRLMYVSGAAFTGWYGAGLLVLFRQAP
ncbi:hypothetical protein JK359_34975 [Streptomyces actinomycinicus]|uniref:Glycosyltransferase RgtA/B/C/D-like domain-containing protein n=1 Tax=Streptomyces actinomycinicus TaxID=1695166 RepID=A0A937EPF8_9ACTN|nr:hypothetical protein [Streptomyces actinomycinicus]MBL1087112.1 hypothetical protein [Streptomyces actinomycinicus]